MIRKAIAVFSGLVTTFLVMMLFEFSNSFFYPFPAGFNTQEPSQVRLFIEANSPGIFLLVIAGWIFGSVAGGVVVTGIAGESGRKVCLVAGVVITTLQVLNFLFLPHPVWAMVVGLAVMIPCYLIGNRFAAPRNS